MPSSQVSAVIFDCDGVLIDSEVLGLEAEHATLAEAGLVYDVAEYQRRFLGMPYDDFHAALDADCRTRTGEPLPADFTQRLTRRHRKIFEERLVAIEGAHDLVRSLLIPKAVASSSILESLNWKLEKTRLKAPFGAHIYSTEHVTRGKPAPDLFLFAAQNIDAEPRTTLVVEDSVNGIKAARAAGMIAAGFTGGGHCGANHQSVLESAGADIVFGSFAALSAYLAPTGG